MEASQSRSNQSLFVSNRYYAIEFLRMFLGGLLFLKGYFFIENISEIYGLIEENMEYSSFIVAHYVAIAHLVGGLMLAFGLFTRLASLVQLPVLIGAVFFIDSQGSMLATSSQLEYSLSGSCASSCIFYLWRRQMVGGSSHYSQKRRKELRLKKSVCEAVPKGLFYESMLFIITIWIHQTKIKFYATHCKCEL